MQNTLVHETISAEYTDLQPLPKGRERPLQYVIGKLFYPAKMPLLSAAQREPATGEDTGAEHS